MDRQGCGATDRRDDDECLDVDRRQHVTLFPSCCHQTLALTRYTALCTASLRGDRDGQAKQHHGPAGFAQAAHPSPPLHPSATPVHRSVIFARPVCPRRPFGLAVTSQPDTHEASWRGYYRRGRPPPPAINRAVSLQLRGGRGARVVLDEPDGQLGRGERLRGRDRAGGVGGGVIAWRNGRREEGREGRDEGG